MRRNQSILTLLIGVLLAYLLACHDDVASWSEDIKKCCKVIKKNEGDEAAQFCQQIKATVEHGDLRGEEGGYDSDYDDDDDELSVSYLIEHCEDEDFRLSNFVEFYSDPKIRTDAGASTGNEYSNLDFVQINGGSFMMGSNDGNRNERPVHRVTVDSFEIMRTEVTVGQYRACVQAGACSEPGTSNDCNWNESGRENHPINCVDWYQAVGFAEWVGARLPTEAEWEYAARGEGREDAVYPWGSYESTANYAVYNESSTAPVCFKPDGNTLQGLCDMAGNVWEWTLDEYYNDYDGAPTDGTAWTNGRSSYRVNRGGSWDSSPFGLRVTSRYSLRSSSSNRNLGFRIVSTDTAGTDTAGGSNESSAWNAPCMSDDDCSDETTLCVKGTPLLESTELGYCSIPCYVSSECEGSDLGWICLALPNCENPLATFCGPESELDIGFLTACY